MKASTMTLALLSGASLLVLGSAPAAHAQTVEGQGAEQTEQDIAGGGESSAQDSEDEGTIVITGSRLVRDGTQAPTPLTVVGAEDLANIAPQGIAEGLNQLPIFQGSINTQQTQLISSTRVRAGNYLNLRNLGPNRVLVQMDGYRLPPTGNNGGVDVNVIPQMLIDRVEVVTGGASAVYGSDAVSGVINYVINKRFTGIKTLAQAGISKYGDAFSYRLGAAAGTSLLDDRLRLQFSAEYYSNDGIPRRTSRPGAADLWIQGSVDPTLQSGQPGTINNPFLEYSNVTSTQWSLGGLVLGGPAALLNHHFLPSGELVPFNPGTPVGRPGFGQGGDGPPNCLECHLVPASTTGQIFGRVGYEISSGVELFSQVSLNSATSTGETTSLHGNIYNIYGDNYFLREQLTPAQLEALGSSSLRMRRYLRDWDTGTKRPGVVPSNQDMKSIIAITGINADLFADWRMDAAFTYGLTDFESVTQEVRMDRFAAAIDAVAGPNGDPVCRVTLVSNRFSDCRPLNVLGVGRADPAAVQWVLGDSRYRIRNYLYSGGVNFAGTLFSTWAGGVQLAFGGEIRKQRILQNSNSDPEVPVDFTGIRGSGNAFSSTNIGTADGSYNVKEVYAETVIPLIADAPFTKSLEVNGAIRHTDYSTSGGVETWKIGSVWQPIEDLTLRGTYSRDIRAPGLFELFSGQNIAMNTAFDPVTNMSHTIPNRSGGNPDLRPEVANTLTLGAVLRPTFLPGFYASADYYKIWIKDAIGIPGSTVQIFQGCGLNPGGPMCDLIIRDANNIPLEIRGTVQNIASIRTKGLDLEAGYRAPFGNGDLSVRAMATHLISFKRQDTPVTDLEEYVGTADIPGFLNSTYPLPKWRGNLDVTFSNDSFSLSVQQRMIGSFVKSKREHWVHNHIGPVFYTDVNFVKKSNLFGGDVEMFLTVNNLFNRKGPFYVTDNNPGTQLPTARMVYDIMGRYFTAGIRTQF